MKVKKLRYKLVPKQTAVDVYITLRKSCISIDYDGNLPAYSVWINVNDDFKLKLKQASEHLKAYGLINFKLNFGRMWDRTR